MIPSVGKSRTQHVLDGFFSLSAEMEADPIVCIILRLRVVEKNYHVEYTSSTIYGQTFIKYKLWQKKPADLKCTTEKLEKHKFRNLRFVTK